MSSCPSEQSNHHGHSQTLIEGSNERNVFLPQLCWDFLESLIYQFCSDLTHVLLVSLLLAASLHSALNTGKSKLSVSLEDDSSIQKGTRPVLDQVGPLWTFLQNCHQSMTHPPIHHLPHCALTAEFLQNFCSFD